MWPFRKKQTLKESGFFRGFTDWHCHILPDVDDGVQTMDEVWLTPHIMEDMPNTTQHLRARFVELQSAYQGNIALNLASENMLDNLFEERLNKNDLLPIGKAGKHLLVETSYFNPPMDLQNILLRIKAKGYYPILAHPERYLYLNESDYQQLKSINVQFQLNQFSLLCLYGKEVKKKALMLQKLRMYDYTGTDLHRLNTLNRAICL